MLLNTKNAILCFLAGILRKRKRIEGAIYSKQKKMKSSSGEKEPKKRFHGLKERLGRFEVSAFVSNFGL